MYPLQVEINPENIVKLTAILKTAYASIVSEISTATNFGVANRRAILAQIDRILQGTGTDVQKFLETELPKYYKVGANDAVKQLRNTGAEVGVAEGFNRVHKEAIVALVDDASRAFGESMSGISRSANLLLGKATRELITQKMAEGTIGGKALREVRQSIKGILQEQGLDALVDKAGHTWTLDRYAEMLYRTKAVEARNRGLANRLVENNYDLVQVSSHSTDCELCGPWEGMILSSTGETPDYPTVADAEADGLFHPNCKHAINALIPSLAKATKAYYPDETTEFISEDQIQSLSNL
jgi:hypothetical protein